MGDQLTCKNIRGCKLWRATEPHSKDRLTWARETPGEHHVFHLETFLRVSKSLALQIFFGMCGHKGMQGMGNSKWATFG